MSGIEINILLSDILSFISTTSYRTVSYHKSWNDLLEF